MVEVTGAVINRVKPPAPRRPDVRFRTRGASLGLTANRTDELVRQIERGLPFKAVETLAVVSGLEVALIGSTIGIPERTMARRKSVGRLSPDESDRLLRVSHIFEKAVELYEGDVGGAVTWLRSPKKALGRQTPLAYLRTELGAREVENLIGRLEYGVFT